MRQVLQDQPVPREITVLPAFREIPDHREIPDQLELLVLQVYQEPRDSWELLEAQDCLALTVQQVLQACLVTQGHPGPQGKLVHRES